MNNVYFYWQCLNKTRVPGLRKVDLEVKYQDIKSVSADEKYNNGTRLALEGVKMIYEHKNSIK